MSDFNGNGNSHSHGRTESYRPYHDQGNNSRADSYRPPQGNFTFRVDRPAGAPSFPPAPPPPSGPARDRDRFGGDRRGNRRGDGRGRGRGGRRWQPPPHLSERALLANAVTNQPEQHLHDSQTAAKFRDLDQLSDDDEQDMEISSHPSQSDSDQPSKKRAKTSAHDESADAAPKWSNPDPYTALPCPDDTVQKKRDVVALIRKARVEEANNKNNSQEAEDFIAFDSSDEEEEGERSEGDKQAPPSKVPEPPKDLPPPLPPGPPPPSAVNTSNSNSRDAASRNVPDQRDPTGPLGTRKRTANDEIKPPDYGQLKKVSMKPAKGNVVQAWQAKKGEDPSPWASVDHSATSNVGFR